MAKIRVHELAKSYKTSSKDMLKRLQEAGISAKASASAVDEAAARAALEGKPPPTPASGGNGGGPTKRPGARALGRTEPRPLGRGAGGAGGAGTTRPLRHGTAPGDRAPARPGGPQARPGQQPRPGAPGQRPGGPRAGGPDRGPRQDGSGGPGQDGPSARTSGSDTPKRPTRSSLQGERGPGSAGGRRRIIIDSQASRGPQGRGGPMMPPRRPRRGRRRRRPLEEPAPLDTSGAQSIDTVRINSGSTVKDVAEYLGVPVPEIIKRLMKLGEMATLTQTLSDDAIEMLAEELEKPIEIVHAADEAEPEPEFADADEDLVERPPVVTIMGHVDHGKTSLLDAIRETEVVAGEAGGITQHIGAYQVARDGKRITFLDTPGHEAFTAMRARGAKVTDIAVIVVAADDGVKPQTEEAIDHAKAADVQMVIAVNKVDKEGAQPERVRTEMTQHGLQPTDWGGDVEFVDVSAKTRQGLDELLETLEVVAEVAELKANPKTQASGVVVESKLDPGRGPVVTLLIQRGTLNVGDALVAGSHWGRVRAMSDYTGTRVTEAGPGDPIEILGFDGVPEAGDFARVVENERKARQLAAERANRIKTEALARRSGTKVSLDDVFKLAAEGRVKELNLVLKADVSGSVEAVEDEIARLPQQEVNVNVIHRGVGGINASDVMLASASDAVILGFNVRPVPDARRMAEQEGVEIRSYAVIYRAIDELRAAMEGMLEPEEVEETLGHAEIRQTFKASRVGSIAGCYVTEGKLVRGGRVRLIRNGTVVHTGQIGTLRRFKEDVREVATGFECGVVLRDYGDVKEGDELEAFDTKRVERALE